MAPTNIFVPGAPSIGRNRRRIFLNGASGGGGGVALPSGALAVYVGSDLMTTMKALPNRMAPNPPVNMVPAPRRMFANAKYYTPPASTSIVDNNAVGPDGLSEASSITSASVISWAFTTNSASVTLPAGTYTMGINVRWKNSGGSDARFRFGPSGALISATATTSWARYSGQFVSTGVAQTINVLVNPVGTSTKVDFEICDFSIYAGSVDLYGTTDTLQGHLKFGAGVGLDTVTTGTGSVKFNGALLGLAQLQNANALTNLTLIYVSKNSGSPSNAAFNAILANSVPGGSSGLMAGLRTITSSFGLTSNSGLVTPAQPTGEIYDPGSSLGSTAMSYDGTTGKLYSNGLLTGSSAVSRTVASVKDLLVGSLLNGATQYFSNYELAAMAIYPRVLTDAEVLQAHKYLKAQVVLSGATVPDSRVLIYEGDSITYGTGAANTQGYPYLAASQMSRGERGPNYGVFGSKFSDMNARLPAVLAMCDLAVADGRTPIVHFGIGSNDFALTVSAATLYNQVKAYAASCRAHGAKVIAATVLSRPDASDALRNAYNPMLAAGVGVDFDGITNFGSNALIGADGAWSNATYFAGDQVHPTGAGYALMAPIAAAAVNALP
jgi:lysophospholipase L1-like esterase